MEIEANELQFSGMLDEMNIFFSSSMDWFAIKGNRKNM